MNTERRDKSTDADRAARPARPSIGGGELILIPKQLRAEWMDVMAHDARMSNAAYRVAGLIGSKFNRHSGDTYVSQEKLADILQWSLRTVQTAIGELEALGYLIVERRELGQRKDGRRACGGRGVANTYAPAFERSRVAATSSGRGFADRVAESWERTQQRAANGRRKDAADCVQSNTEARSGLRPLEPERTQNQGRKDAADCVPTLGDPTDHNPARGRAAARVNAAAHPLGAALLELVKRLGEGAVQTWFAGVSVEAEEAGRLVLAAPSRFTRDWLAGKHEQDVRDAWNRSRPIGSTLVDRVEFVVRK